MMTHQKMVIPRFQRPQDSFLYWLSQMQNGLKLKWVRHVVWNEEASSSFPLYLVPVSDEGCDAAKDAWYARYVACSVIPESPGEGRFLSPRRYQKDPPCRYTVLNEWYKATTTFNKATIYKSMAGIKSGSRSMNMSQSGNRDLCSAGRWWMHLLNKRLRVIMFTESFGDRLKSLYGNSLSALLTK